MTYLLKRILPFVLTTYAGLVFAYQWRLYNQPVPQLPSLVDSRAESNLYSYYDYECRCMFWTTDSKQWVSIKELPEPYFTEEAQIHNFSGGVQMRVLLGADGTVLQAIPYGPLPYGLTEEIIKAAKRIKFDPATVFGPTPESVWVRINYEFKTIPGYLSNSYQTRVYVFDHYDVDHHGRERRLER
jgi:Gram-negative bacterial TonB protein C-terminal